MQARVMVPHAVRASHRLVPDGQGDLRPQGVEDARHLHGDVARAHDEHAPRQVFHVEEAIAVDGMLHTGHIGHTRCAPGGDDDVVRRVQGVAHPHRVGVHEYGLHGRSTPQHAGVGDGANPHTLGAGVSIVAM